MKKKILLVLVAVAVLSMGLAAIPVLADTVGQLHSVQLAPNNPILVVGTTQQFGAQAYDESNQALTNVNYFWLVTAGGGTISSTGLFTAGSVPGTFTNTVEVIAAQGTIVKTAGVTVIVTGTPGPLDHVQVTPASATIIPGGTKLFAAQGYDAANIPIAGLNYTWSITAGGGTMDTTGLFTAGTTAGTFTGTVQAATIQGAITKTGNATVIIAANPTTTTTTTPITTPTPKASPKIDVNKLINMFKGYLNNAGFDNFLGGQWQVKNGTAIDTIKIIPGIVQTASATTLVIVQNGQTAASTFSLTSDTVIQPKNTVLAANDKVIVVTTNDQVSLVVKVTVPSTTALPLGLNKKDDDSRDGKNTPPGWSKGDKTGWSNSSGNDNQVKQKKD